MNYSVSVAMDNQAASPSPSSRGRSALALGIDLGTSGLKAIALSADGVARGSARVAYTSLDPAFSEAEQDPALWLAAMARAIALLGQEVDLRRVAGVGLSGQTHGLVLVDERGKAVAPCMTWADARCNVEAAELREIVGDEVTRRTGNVVLESFTAPKMLWAMRHWPETRTARLCLPKDFLRLVLTGQWATDPSDAASTLLFDLADQRWAPTLVHSTGFGEHQLPPVQPSASIAGRVTKDGAALSGLPEGTPVVTGASDVACAALGAGLVGPGTTYLNVGTAAQLLTVAEPRPELTGRFVFQHCLPNLRLAAGTVYSAGLSLKWYLERMGSSGAVISAGPATFRRADRLASAVPPGARGLMFLPYLTGSSLPAPDPLARGAFVGLSTMHGTAECLRAILEGVGYGLRTALESLEEGGPPARRLVLGGGAAASRLWPQILAGVLGRELSLLRRESSPVGAALLGAIGVGMFRDVDQAIARSVSVKSTHEASPETRNLYDRGYGEFARIDAGLRPVFPGLARLSGAEEAR
jgi:xylulokinase